MPKFNKKAYDSAISLIRKLHIQAGGLVPLSLLIEKFGKLFLDDDPNFDMELFKNMCEKPKISEKPNHPNPKKIIKKYLAGETQKKADNIKDFKAPKQIPFALSPEKEDNFYSICLGYTDCKDSLLPMNPYPRDSDDFRGYNEGFADALNDALKKANKKNKANQ